VGHLWMTRPRVCSRSTICFDGRRPDRKGSRAGPSRPARHSRPTRRGLPAAPSRLRRRSLQPQGIPEVVPLGAEVGSARIDRFQEHQKIPPIRRSQLRLNRGHRRKLLPIWPQPVQPEDILGGLGLATLQVRRVIVDTEQRRHVEPIHPKRRAGGAVIADLQRIGDLPALCRPNSAPLTPPSVPGVLDHVGCHASRSMRPTICRDRVGVKWFSASCKMKYRACRIRPRAKARLVLCLGGHMFPGPLVEFARMHFTEAPRGLHQSPHTQRQARAHENRWDPPA
jgi:hypothetical protein